MAPLTISWVEQRLIKHRPEPISDDVVGRRAAVTVILQEALQPPGEAEILFIRRTEHSQDRWSGQMAFPGGMAEKGDASLLRTALRESCEEVGIDLGQDGRLLGQLDDVRASARGKVLPIAITPYVFALTGPIVLVVNESEVEEVHWIAVSMLLDPALRSTVPYFLAQERFDLPCIRVCDRTIWGLTYQMLMRFFSLMEWGPGVRFRPRPRC